MLSSFLGKMESIRFRILLAINYKTIKGTEDTFPPTAYTMSFPTITLFGRGQCSARMTLMNQSAYDTQYERSYDEVLSKIPSAYLDLHSPTFVTRSLHYISARC